MKGVVEGRDIDKKDVAKAVGVANSTYTRWESGAIPDDDNMEALARYFGVTAAWLHYGTAPRERPPEEKKLERPARRGGQAGGEGGRKQA